MNSKRKIEIVIPTFNGGRKFIQVAEMLQKQIGIKSEDVLIIDSSSSDQTVAVAENAGFRVMCIDKSDFGHGRTRRMAVEQSQAEYIVFLTQDAIPVSNDSIIKLCEPLMENGRIGLTYGRQLPSSDVDLIGNHARLFNYPPQSQMKTKSDIPQLGIKAIFCSDSFAAYNRQYMIKLGNFMDVAFGEDTLAADMFIKNGYGVFYNADACVYHAHSFTLFEDFRRNMDIGKLHRSYCHIFSQYGRTYGEGLRYVKSLIGFLLMQRQIRYFPFVFFHVFFRFVGYNVGKSGLF